MLSFQRGTHRTQRKRRWRKSPVDTIDPAAVALGRKDRLMEELAHAPLTPEARRDREESDQEVTVSPQYASANSDAMSKLGRLEGRRAPARSGR